MALIGKLKCADLLIRRGLQVSASCSFCHTSLKSHFHLFFECDFSFSVLTALLSGLDSFLFRPNILQIFDFLDNVEQFNSLEKNFYFHLVNCIIYHLWRERNNRRFSNAGLDPISICFAVKLAIRFKLRRWKSQDKLKEKAWIWFLWFVILEQEFFGFLTMMRWAFTFPFSLWKVFWQPWNFAEWTCALLLEPCDGSRALPFVLFSRHVATCGSFIGL
ncbi:hypothetical protein M5K25_014678 [Dendrobium thyrsiflorum]|uniref:Reverse transcriptase zinc-binding domain-containing protein n=1 Tax=Dendrobium thyrsiflorum TaxID=117978 RepID=A0ABD0UVC8_DENTH